MVSDLLANPGAGAVPPLPAAQGEGMEAGLARVHGTDTPLVRAREDHWAPPSLALDVKLKWKRWKDTPWLYAEVPEILIKWCGDEAARKRAWGEKLRFQTNLIMNEVTSLVGEYAAASLFRRSPNFRLQRGGDGGADLVIGAKRVDVKTLAKTVIPQPRYSCLIVKEQLPSKNDDEVLAFFSYTKTSRLVFALGYLAVREFMAKAVLREDGPMPPRWEVRVSDLKPVGDLLKGYCDWYNTDYCRLMNRGAEYCPGYVQGPGGGCRRWSG